MRGFSIKFYQRVSLLLAALFAVVGAIFLLLPQRTVKFFNALSQLLGMAPAPVTGLNFFLILAVGYMYAVTVLAVLMARQPRNPVLPLLLAHAKIASSLLSFGFFLFHLPSLIYLANGIVDGAIGILALCFYLRLKKLSTAGRIESE